MKQASFLDDADSKLVPTNWLLMRPRSRSERFFSPAWLAAAHYRKLECKIQPQAHERTSLCSCEYLSNTAHCLLSFPLPRLLSPFSFLSPCILLPSLSCSLLVDFARQLVPHCILLSSSCTSPSFSSSAAVKATWFANRAWKLLLN